MDFSMKTYPPKDAMKQLFSFLKQYLQYRIIRYIVRHSTDGGMSWRDGIKREQYKFWYGGA